MKRLACLISAILLTASTTVAFAAPQSPNYQLQQYSFGSGGTTPDTASPNNKLFGNSGEPESDPSSANYTINGGTAGMTQSPTPQTPTIVNDHQNYDRLHITLNPGTDPTDTTYAIAISPDAFATTTYFVTTSLTFGSSAQYQTYAAWGGSSGFVVTGLLSNTTYTIKVKEMQGSFSESLYSPTASATTLVSTLTFTVGGSSDLGNLSQSNSYTATTNQTLTTSTNAFNGYNIYAHITGPISMQGGSSTIANFSGTYASPSSWTSGVGFGYTTNDTDINSSPKWNANPCPGDNGTPLCYAAFSQTGPGDVVADHETDLTSSDPISNEAFNVTYKLSTTGTQPAGNYITTVIYTVAPVY